jgi:hypothetical protein
MRVRTEARSNFRRRELNELLGVLSARRPAVVLLCGDPGMGKTELLREFELRALALGWEVLGGEATERLPIDPSTTERTLRERVLAALPDPIEPEPPRRSRVVSDPHLPALTRERVEEGPPDPFVDDLSRAAPLLLVIDDYRPSPPFADWFENRFLAGVKAADAAIVVTVAQRPGARPLEDLATHVLNLEQLDPELVRQELAGVLALLDPPVSPEEEDAYVREANTPVQLDGLLRVLSLARRPGAAP